jgi:CheY-like chemotaxis protein/GAF domain-containing protein
MATKRARILVVDDERFFREAIREALEGAGLECVTAANGPEALELAREGDFGVVVLDIQLPGIDGIEVLRRLREMHPALRVVILSAHTDQEIVLEALRLGASDYLAKPLHDEELVLAVKRALETHAIAAGWDKLRARLSLLESKLGELVRESSSEEPPLDLPTRAAETVADVLGAAKTSLLLVDEAGSRLRVAAATGRKLAIEEFDAVPVGQGVAGAAFSRAQAMLVEDAASDARVSAAAAPEKTGRYDSGSFAVAPVPSPSGVLGVLCATDRAGGAPFEETDLAVLRILAVQVGQLLTQRRLASVTSASAARGATDPDRTLPAPSLAASLASDESAPRDADLARQVCEAVSAEVEPRRVLDAAIRPIALALEAAPVALFLRDAETGELVCEGQVDGGRCADRMRISALRGLTGTVLATGNLVATPKPQDDPRFDPDVDTPEGGDPAPLLCLPLRFRGKVLGVLRAFPRSGIAPSARTGEVLAAALSAAVRNVFLYRSLVDSIEEVARARREAGLA